MGPPRSRVQPSILPAKVTAPTLTAVFLRTRLFRVLDRARAPIVWITGMPGAGKTTLVASYLAARRTPALWYQLDPGDADPATFFHYLGIAANRAAPQYRTALPHLTPEYRPELGTFTQRYMQMLCERLPHACVLVLDNYQAVPLESPFHEMIREVLAAIPSGRRVFVTSRSEPPPALVRLRASQALEVLDSDALRATPQETRGIVRLKYPMSGAAIRALHETTGGWIAGIILLAQRAANSELSMQERPDTIRKDVFDYFAGEILERSEPQVQEFLLQTAFLPKMTVRMAEQLTGRGRSGQILEELSRQHYFTERCGDDPAIYQYHSLFRRFLLTKAHEMWTPVTLSQIRHRAAIRQEEAGQIDDAVRLFREAGDWAGAGRLAVRQAPLLIAQGRHATLDGWLSSLPTSMVEEDPWLLYWVGACRQPVDAQASRDHFERAFERFLSQRDEAGCLQAWSGAVSAILCEWDDCARLDRWIAWLDERMQREPSFPSREVETRVACDMARALLYRHLHHPQIHCWMERALSLSQESPDDNLRLQVTVTTAHYFLWTGQLGMAQELIGEIKTLARSPGVTPVVSIQGKWVEGLYHWLTGSYLQCLQAVSEGLAISRTSGVRAGETMLYADGVYANLALGDLKAARECLRKLEAAADRSRHMEVGHYHLIGTIYALRCGEIDRAVEHGKKGIGVVTKTGLPFAEASMHLAMAQALHEQGTRRKASQHLDLAHRMFRQMKSLVMDYTCLLTRAQFASGTGTADSEARGLKALREAMRLGRQRGYINMPGWRPDIMAGLCAKALEHGIEVNYVNHLIRTRDLAPDTSLAGCEHWPWPLKIYTLGRFSMVKGSIQIRTGTRGQGRVLELLKALIALGGRGVEEARLAEALWPESDGDVAHQAFKTTLHRLRKLLGNEEVISVRDGRVTLEARCCWVDVWAFDRLLGRRTPPRSDSPGLGFVPSSLEQAIALYHGHFLGHETGSAWAMALRERLHAKFLRAVSELGRHWEAVGEWKQASGCYHRGLAVDPLVEEYYQRLIVCHQRQGQSAEAVSVYQRCRDVLHASLGIAPSRETEAMCRSVRAGSSLST